MPASNSRPGPRPSTPLATLRIAGGFSRAVDAAPQLGVSRMHLLLVEQGRASASNSLLEKMATVYASNFKSTRRAFRKSRRAYLKAELRKVS